MNPTHTTALLIVDVQQALVRQGPWGKERLLKTISALQADFRLHGRPVLFVRHDDGPGTPLAYGAPGWQIAPQAAPRRGERVFDKRHNSAFLDTGLDAYLQRQHADTLVIAGLQTEYCIDATIKSAFERGYRVLIPAGAVSTFRNGRLPARKINLFFHKYIWQGRYGTVLPLPKLLKEVNP